MRSFLVGALVAFAVPASAEYASVTAELVNVRESAGTASQVLWKAWRYTPFEIVEWGEQWALVRDFEGDEGWVSRSVLSLDPGVIVVGKRANVREGPGVQFDIVEEVEREYPLRVLGYDGDWIKVTDGVDANGWIHRKLVWGCTRPASEAMVDGGV